MIFDLEQTILGQSWRAWLLALTATIGGYLLIRFARFLALRRLSRAQWLTNRQWTSLILNCLRRINLNLLLIIVVYVGSRFLRLPAGIAPWLDAMVTIAVILQAAFWISESITFWFVHLEARLGNGDPSRLTTMRSARVALRVLLAAIVVLLIMDNIPGVEITALVASLGIGGIAVALAVQNILGDLFASLSIVLDKPFVVGDFIVVDDLKGTVEAIGIKTTRLRSLSGEQLIFANNDLLKSRIRNFKRMQERRVVFSLGVVYQTSADKLERIPAMIRTIIEAVGDTRFDRAHFMGYGESALNFEMVYYVLSPDYNVYMNIQQTINLEIYRQFARERIDFAYPTRTIFMNAAAGVQEPGAD